MKNYQISFIFAAKEAFSLISRLDGRAIRSNVNLLHGNVEMWTRNENDPNQWWVASDYGQQFINVGTNLPLAAGIGKSWIWDKEGMVLKNARKPNEVMDRGWKQEDGKSIGTFGRHNGTNQLFINTLDTFPTSALGTGWPIKIHPHSFNLICSRDRVPSNFKTAFNCYTMQIFHLRCMTLS